MKERINLKTHLIDDIAVGRFGVSGSHFPGVRDVAAEYGVSYVTAQRACEKLRQDGYIRLFGGRTFLTTGRIPANTPLAGILKNARGGCKRFGLHISRVDNLFFTSLAAQLQSISKQHGWQLIIMTSNGEVEMERNIIDEFLDLGVSGIFTCPGKVNVYEHCVLPVVCLGRSVMGGNAVQVNNKSAGAQIAAHLLEEGYRHFLYVGTDALNSEQDFRLMGYEKQLASSGYQMQAENIFSIHTADPARDVQIHMIRQRIQELEGSVAIFCYHDMLAFGILDMCRRSGIDVPEKAGVVGFDDLQSADYMGNQLTTISYRYDLMAQKAVELMLTLLYEENPVIHEDIYVNQALTVRASTVLRSNGNRH